MQTQQRSSSEMVRKPPTRGLGAEAADAKAMRPRPSFETFASDRLLAERSALARAWTDVTVEVLGNDPRRSGADALDGALFDAILVRLAIYAKDGDAGAFAKSDEVVSVTMALGAWCARHGNDARAAVSVFDRLAELLDDACGDWVADFHGDPAPIEVVRVTGRLNRGPLLMAAQCVAELERTWLAAPAPGDFAELLAHELSTPINAAEVAAVLLESEKVTAGSQELRRLAGTIQRSLRRVRALIGDVRDLSAAHAGEASGERHLLIGQVLGAVLADMSPLAREAGVRVDVEEPVPGIRVQGAPVSIVLRNLVSNAIKYADPKAEKRWARISFVEIDGAWVVAVSDNGLGIPHDQHHRVFSRFMRLHPERADGTGLGLTIARQTARRMNGDIEFDSEPGVGSTFRFVLPAEVAPGTPAG